jgi:hypothetical protein
LECNAVDEMGTYLDFRVQAMMLLLLLLRVWRAAFVVVAAPSLVEG